MLIHNTGSTYVPFVWLADTSLYWFPIISWKRVPIADKHLLDRAIRYTTYVKPPDLANPSISAIGYGPNLYRIIPTKGATDRPQNVVVPTPAYMLS